MPGLPLASEFTGSAVTEAQQKTVWTNQREFLAGLLGTTGTQAAALAAIGAALNGKLDKSAAYTVVANDRGKVINATAGTWTLAVTAAATLGDGFVFGVLNSGAGTITIDPDAAEQIDGAATKAMAPGKLAIVYCDGTKFTTVGSLATGPGSGLDADMVDGLHASSFKTLAGVTASDNYEDTILTSVGTASGSYTKLISRRVYVTGTIRVRYSASAEFANSNVRVYKNNVAVGVDRLLPVGETLYSYTDDITVTAGDVIQLYARSNGGAGGIQVYGPWLGCSAGGKVSAGARNGASNLYGMPLE